VRSLIGALVNRAPVPYSGRSQISLPWRQPSGTEAHLRAMGSVGTLFAIVDRNAGSTSKVGWQMFRAAQPGQDPKDRPEVTRHAALDLWNRPNKFFTRQLLVETIQQHYELVGEGILVIARNPRSPLPLELWPVSPHRMDPVPDADDYLSGWIYRGPDGQQIPLGLDEVIQIRRPNPIDPYRGIGAVQTILADLQGVQLSAEWNRNFFANSAEPGGIIEVPGKLGDDDFDELRARWNEQHKGVANAHRVAILEHGTWKDRKHTQRDMQFAELRGVSREVIREAFGMPKFALGDVEDVNRATAEASKTWYAEEITVPRLERIKQALNTMLLPLYGTTGAGVEFDFVSPVPGDREADDRERESRAGAARDLVEAGYYAPEVLAAVGLPEISFGQPNADPNRELLIDLVKGAPTLAPMILPMLGFDVPAPEPAAPPAAPAVPAPPAARLDIHHHPGGRPAGPAPVETVTLSALARRSRAHRSRPPALTAAADDDDAEPVEEPGLAGVRTDLEAALADLLEAWEPIESAQIEELAEQVERLVDDGDTEALAAMTVDTAEAGETLRSALADMAETAAGRMAEEAAAQGVKVKPPKVDDQLTARLASGQVVNFGSELFDIAAGVVALLGAGLAQSAGREALRLFAPGGPLPVADPDEDEPDESGSVGAVIAGRVRKFLRGLKGRAREDALGGALHRATNLGRLAVLDAAPAGRYLASEVNDRNRCEPCEEIDGTELETLDDVYATYGLGGYPLCEGGERCRGTVEVVWD
jgi:HK97 family phage portal protein